MPGNAHKPDLIILAKCGYQLRRSGSRKESAEKKALPGTLNDFKTRGDQAARILKRGGNAADYSQGRAVYSSTYQAGNSEKGDRSSKKG